MNKRIAFEQTTHKVTHRKTFVFDFTRKIIALLVKDTFDPDGEHILGLSDKSSTRAMYANYSRICNLEAVLGNNFFKFHTTIFSHGL